MLDPETTFSLPQKQVRNGVVDAFVHVLEQYMTYPAAAPLQDRLAESILQTLVEAGPVTLAEPRDYEARATFMWSALCRAGTRPGAWAVPTRGGRFALSPRERACHVLRGWG